ncbi:hypothetical protein B0I35DRAFT_507838 [Stachybotrys elegans]|uniref:Mid2 domain-containing protein n=1 Tax=Stachybotrys elegans TaxID=80388 RepID=A0A8K0WXC7_9HYPO|nr:hypothetical protein B0I35DRAFT_507838 [Stachybotrys elegans]
MASLSRQTRLLGALLGLVLLPHAVHAQAQCYVLTGEEADDSVVPCNPDARHSPCCASNKSTPDICLSSGLCYAEHPGFKGLIYSNGCTDRNFEDDACPSVCASWLRGQDLGSDWDGNYNLQACGRGGVYCCRLTNDDSSCCDDRSAVVTLDIGNLVLPTSTVTRTRTVAPASASGAAEEPDTTTTTVTETIRITDGASLDGQSLGNDGVQTSEDCPADNTAVVAGSLGGVLGAALLASLGVIAVLWRRRQPMATASHTAAPPIPAGKYAEPMPAELGPPKRMYEMDG